MKLLCRSWINAFVEDISHMFNKPPVHSQNLENYGNRVTAYLENLIKSGNCKVVRVKEKKSGKVRIRFL